MKKITITVNDNGMTKLEVEMFKTISEFMDTMVGGMLQMMETHAHCNPLEAIDVVVQAIREYQRALLEEDGIPQDEIEIYMNDEDDEEKRVDMGAYFEKKKGKLN